LVRVTSRAYALGMIGTKREKEKDENVRYIVAAKASNDDRYDHPPSRPTPAIILPPPHSLTLPSLHATEKPPYRKAIASAQRRFHKFHHLY